MRNSASRTLNRVIGTETGAARQVVSSTVRGCVLARCRTSSAPYLGISHSAIFGVVGRGWRVYEVRAHFSQRFRKCLTSIGESDPAALLLNRYEAVPQRGFEEVRNGSV